MPNLPRNKECTGCLACIDSCKRGAISISIEHGLRYPNIDNDVCVNCGLCEKHCPVLNSFNHNKRDEIVVKGGWCTNAEVRRHSASGGAFSAMAMYALAEGGYAVGASLNEDNTVTHKVIHSIDELSVLQNSKYIQSNTTGIYEKVKNLLKNGERVLFSGTPCQTAALHSYLGKDYDNLVTVDVVCNGVPSNDAINVLIREKKATKILSYRGKDFGWNDVYSQGVSYENECGGVFFPLRSKDLFYRIFACGLTHRNSCCDCKFSSLPRYADITIADFWGIKRFEEEWNNGISLIIANNKKGEDYISRCDKLHTFESSLEECINANPRIANGRKYHGWHPVMLWRTPLRRMIGETLYEKIILNEMPWKLLWGILKIMTIVSNKKTIKKELSNEKNRNSNHF